MKEAFNLTYLGLFPLGKSPGGKGMGIKMSVQGMMADTAIGLLLIFNAGIIARIVKEIVCNMGEESVSRKVKNLMKAAIVINCIAYGLISVIGRYFK